LRGNAGKIEIYCLDLRLGAVVIPIAVELLKMSKTSRESWHVLQAEEHGIWPSSIDRGSREAACNVGAQTSDC